MNSIATVHLIQPEVHIVPDIETLGTKGNAKILSIGAVAVIDDSIVGQFYVNIDPESYKDFKDGAFAEDQSTIDWWNKPEMASAREALQHEQHHIEDAIEKFSKWIAEAKGSHVWGYGAEFDNTILKNAFDVVGVIWPFKFYNHRCLRTLANTLNVRVNRNEGTHHNALHDAVNQGKALIQCYEILSVVNNSKIRKIISLIG